MAIDAKSEDVMTLGKARHLMPDPPHIQTMRKYAREKTIESFKRGGVFYTSREAIFRYLDRLSREGA
jgi:hypothetical protein